MNNDWIKFERLTLDKPEVWQIAADLSLDQYAVVGRLLSIWCWFDEHTTDGITQESAIPMLNSRVSMPGFCESMIKVKWMIREAGQIKISRFEKHNGACAKKRANSSVRAAKHRAKANAENRSNASVTEKVTEKSQKSNALSVTFGVTKTLLARYKQSPYQGAEGPDQGTVTKIYTNTTGGSTKNNQHETQDSDPAFGVGF